MDEQIQGRPVVAVSFINFITAVIVFVILGFEAWIHVNPQTGVMGIYSYHGAPQPIFVLTQSGSVQLTSVINNGWLHVVEWSGDKLWTKYALIQSWYLKGLYSSLMVLADMVMSWLSLKKSKKLEEEE